MVLRVSGLVKDGAKRRRSAVSILDEAGHPESRLAKRSMAQSRSGVNSARLDRPFSQG
jgi:hypothetical protein